MSAAEEQTSVGRPNHASLGASYLASLAFPEEVCSVVRQHVNAKKYLCAVDRGYYDALSDASKVSLRQQGGPMDEDQRREWEKETVGWEDCVKVRRWDDAAKVVGIEEVTPRGMSYVHVVGSCLQ
jgi:predicted HD phosphohydrolase